MEIALPTTRAWQGHHMTRLGQPFWRMLNYMNGAERSHDHDRAAILDLLRASAYADQYGNINRNRFFEDIKEEAGYSVEQLRRMLSGAQPLQMRVLAVMARRLGKDPRYFRGYRAYLIDQAMEKNPELVDILFAIIEGEENARQELGSDGPA